MQKSYKTLVKIASLILASIGAVSLANAESNTNFNVTVNPSISVSLSSPNLIIPKLTPGTAADSNIITINVTTNSPNGYTLNASVGNTTFNTRDLIHQNTSVSSKFSSLATNASVAENTNLNNNTWGYAYLDESLNNGTNTTWSAYSGLPLYSDTANIATLKDTTNSAENTIKFKIAAKASVDQLAGEYNNVINFTAVAAPLPSYDANLDTGQTVNQKLKRLAGNSSATHIDADNNITALVRSDTLPSGFTPTTENTISTTSSAKPIYAWYDSANKTIYYYSEATTIKMNQDSSYFFHNMYALSNLSTISSWNTSSVTNMHEMFYSAGFDATTFTLDLSSWNTSSVTNMFYMFYNAGYKATTFTLDLSSWNTSSVTNMGSMFSSAGYKATTFTLDLSSWNISSVTSMSNMFQDAGYKATTFTLDLSSWNTSSVTNMYGMFYRAGYSAATFTLDLSSWNTASVTSMSWMFSYAGYNATTWSVTIPKTNKGSAPITNTTSRFYGNTTSVYTEPLSGKSFTIAN